MALLRMTAAALVACSSAAAEPGAPPGAPPVSAPSGAPPASAPSGTPSVGAPPSALPPGWRSLPPVATAVAAAAAADGVVIDAAVAFGEPATGCYAVWLALHGPAAGAPALADQVLDSFGADAAPRAAVAPPATGARAAAGPVDATAITLSEVVKPTGATGVLGFAFARPPYHGRVRAQLGDGRIAATACFANQREPLACDAACTRLLQDAPPALTEGAR